MFMYSSTLNEQFSWDEFIFAFAAHPGILNAYILSDEEVFFRMFHNSLLTFGHILVFFVAAILVSSHQPAHNQWYTSLTERIAADRLVADGCTRCFETVNLGGAILLANSLISYGIRIRRPSTI
jgi:hypothetical protein